MARETHREIVEVAPTDARFNEVVQLATTILDQGRYLIQQPDDNQESHIVAAFAENRCVGFLRFVVQTIGEDVGRPPVLHNGSALREGYVEAFGVDRSGVDAASAPSCRPTQLTITAGRAATKCGPAAR